MNRFWCALADRWLFAAAARGAHSRRRSAIEIVGPDGRTFREFPVNARDGALRSYLQAEKGARYEVRVHNTTGERLGLVIAVDGRNIINGGKSELARTEPMYVLGAWDTEDLCRLARQSRRRSTSSTSPTGAIHTPRPLATAPRAVSSRVAVYREVPPPAPVYQPNLEDQRGRVADAQGNAPAEPPAATLPLTRRKPSAANAVTNLPVPATATGALIGRLRWSSSRRAVPTPGISSSTNGARRCAASRCWIAATTTVSGMNPR